MTPLFATQASQSQAMDYEDSVDGQIRATQDAQQFTQTVEAGQLALSYDHGYINFLDNFCVSPTFLPYLSFVFA